MEIAVLLILTIVLFMIGLVNKAVKDSVYKMSNPKPLFVIQDTVEDKGFRAIFGATAAGAEKHGFEQDCLFDFHGLLFDEPAHCATWKNDVTQTLLVLYYAQGKSFFDFVTLYDDKTGLTTCSSTKGLTLPYPPGSYVQGFTKLDLSALLRKHEEARARLERKLNLSARELSGDTIDLMTTAMQQQMSYVQTLPGWNWRGAYWYFIRRKLLVNRALRV